MAPDDAAPQDCVRQHPLTTAEIAYDFEAIARAADVLAGALGDGGGLADTPRRHAHFWQEFLSPTPFRLTTFDSEGMSQMIVQHGIWFYSVCEHHLVPFFGTATVAYVPAGQIIGLSKLARLVDWYARRPQNQERITMQVAQALEAALAPKGVGVILRARHLCMEMRGIKKPGTMTDTSTLTGVFLHDGRTRAELFAVANGSQ